MSLVWHIVKKDFLRMWVALVLWALVLAMKNEMGGVLVASAGADRLRFEAVGYWSIGLTGFGVLVNFLLVATLVQEDALVGSRMFWMTRPISGRRLLAAKLLGGALMFGALPVLVSLRWWLACGYGGSEIVRATVATLEGQLVVVTSALVLASLTENMNRFLGWSLTALLASAVLAWRPATMDPLYVSVPETMGLITTKIWLMSLLGIGAAGFVVVQQFQDRQTKRALGMLAIAAMLLVAVKQAWSWDWTGKAPRLEASPQPGGLVSFQLERARMTVSRDGSGSVALDYRIKGLNEAMVVRARADHFWEFPEGNGVVARSNLRNAGWPGRAEWKALGLVNGTDASMRNYASAAPPGNEEDMLRLVSWMRASTLGRLRGTVGSYRAELEVELLRPENWIELPLREGGRKTRAGVGARIGTVESQAGGLKVSLTESQPVLESYGKTSPSFTSLNVLSPGDEAIALGYALVNRRRGEAIKLWPKAQRAAVGLQALRHLTFTVPLPSEQVGAWLEEATLVVVRYRSIGVFSSETNAASLTVVEEEGPL